MSDPIRDLEEKPLDERMRNRICGMYKSRGIKALGIVDQNRIKRYRDFFVVVGKSREYVVEDDFCDCEDFLHRGGSCAHILAVRIARATGRYELIDLWYYEALLMGLNTSLYRATQ
jgi:predicted nucleic acid-binding Zn finger protein